MLLNMIVEIVGVAPVGWEFVPYLIACILSLLLFSVLGNVFTFLFRRFRG